jgi:hypothetical protein
MQILNILLTLWQYIDFLLESLNWLYLDSSFVESFQVTEVFWLYVEMDVYFPSSPSARFRCVSMSATAEKYKF